MESRLHLFSTRPRYHLHNCRCLLESCVLAPSQPWRERGNQVLDLSIYSNQEIIQVTYDGPFVTLHFLSFQLLGPDGIRKSGPSFLRRDIKIRTSDCVLRITKKQKPLEQQGSKKRSTDKEEGTATVCRQSTFTMYRPDAAATIRTGAAAKYQMDPIPQWLSKVNLCKCYLFLVTAVHQQLPPPRHGGNANQYTLTSRWAELYIPIAADYNYTNCTNIRRQLRNRRRLVERKLLLGHGWKLCRFRTITKPLPSQPYTLPNQVTNCQAAILVLGGYAIRSKLVLIPPSVGKRMNTITFHSEAGQLSTRINRFQLESIPEVLPGTQSHRTIIEYLQRMLGNEIDHLVLDSAGLLTIYRPALPNSDGLINSLMEDMESTIWGFATDPNRVDYGLFSRRQGSSSTSAVCPLWIGMARV
ncbi:unnamed protein product [Nezara viridula]|uniref:Uncharacterized protein n=1 Tax=Nezara viridula TaxID=85310 RepID=A0A9P0E8V5_NEZVI|nr:unnamed protein product [Nezara viridula]